MAVWLAADHWPADELFCFNMHSFAHLLYFPPVSILSSPMISCSSSERLQWILGSGATKSAVALKEGRSLKCRVLRCRLWMG